MSGEHRWRSRFAAVMISSAVVALLVGSDGTSRLAAARAEKPVVLAILHFSVIKGTTWSGAHHRAAERIVEKFPNVKYVFREEVGPDSTIPVAEELIRQGANIVVGNAEFMGLPLEDLADKYPNVYFASVVASDITTRRNFIRFFPRQYQALYLEGLIAAALTRTGNVGVVSALPNLQVFRRTAGFYLGVQDGAKALGRKVNVFVKYVGDWYEPAREREVATTLATQQKVDVIGQQTDSRSPLDVAHEKKLWFVGKDMDVVGFYGWSSTDTVAVSFDTRWEVFYDRMVEDFMAGKQHPRNFLHLGMSDTVTLPDGTEEPALDLMNDLKVGLDAISPKARPLIPLSIQDLVRRRRDQMLKGTWDPFEEHALVSNGTGLALDGTPIPPKGTVVKNARTKPTDEWLLGKFNFDLSGLIIVE